MEKTSRNDFEALIRRAGLRLSTTQIVEIHEAWALVEPMLERIRNHTRDRAAEPAHIFRADAYVQHPGRTEAP
jgi:hypothetical protein